MDIKFRLNLIYKIIKEFFDAIYSQGLEYDSETVSDENLDEEKGLIIDFGLFGYAIKREKEE